MQPHGVHPAQCTRGMPRGQVMPIIGELFRLQGFINLHSSIRETPDEFWDDDRRCVRLACDRPLMETCARVRCDAHSLTHAPTHARAPTRARVGARTHTSNSYSFTDMDAHALPPSMLMVSGRWAIGFGSLWPPQAALRRAAWPRYTASGRSLQPGTTCCNHGATCCNTAGHVAACCNTVQHKYDLLVQSCVF
jgi:hypothetical protein